MTRTGDGRPILVSRSPHAEPHEQQRESDPSCHGDSHSVPPKTAGPTQHSCCCNPIASRISVTNKDLQASQGHQGICFPLRAGKQRYREGRNTPCIAFQEA